MNRIHKRRLYYLGFLAVGLTLATSLILYALKQNIHLFLTPSQLTPKTWTTTHPFRLGGMVKQGSLVHDPTGLATTFTVTDFKQEIRVHYTGILPDLFREGQGVIAEGHLSPSHELIASQVLAKHDENYQPPAVKHIIQSNQRD
jgi:cytochrome c-type biogenesis protein CcmE